MNNVNNIIDNDLCSGCGGCVIVCPKNCIKIIEGNSNKAMIDESKCISCGLCNKVCPSEKNKKNILTNNIDIIGNYKECFVGNSTEYNLRLNAASGGIITSITHYLVTNNIVDGVIMIKGSREFPLKNEVIIIDSVDDLISSPGSRYSPASTCLGLKYIDKSKKYIFVGKPCEVSAVHDICKINKDISNTIKFKIAIMCYQTPELKGTINILEENNINPSDVISIKYRGGGWPGYFECITSDKRIKMTYLEAWNKYLCKNGNIGCKICMDSFANKADIVVGDPWSDKYKDETIGKSVCIVRTEIAESIISEMVKKSQIDKQKVTIDEVINCQKQLLKKIDEVSYLKNALKFTTKEDFSILNIIKEYKFKFKKYYILIKKILVFFRRSR